MAAVQGINNPTELGLLMMILLAIPSLYSNLLPYPCDLPKAPTGMVRKSEIQAGIMSVGIGFAGSLITNSPLPFFAAVAMTAFLTWHYESANRTKEDEVY